MCYKVYNDMLKNKKKEKNSILYEKKKFSGST